MAINVIPMFPTNNSYLTTQPTTKKTTNILEDIKKRGTFVVNPEDEPVIQELSKKGFTQEQIVKGLEAKRKLEDANNAPVDEAVDTTTTPISEDPFQGKTRTQVLREAFIGGVTNAAELEKIGKTYDMLSSGEGELETGTDMAGQALAKQSIEKEAIKKMQALPDATGRDSALSALSTFRTGKDIISTLEGGKVKTGLLEGGARQGIFGIGGRSLGMTTKEEDAFASLTEVFAANFRKALSGTAVAEGEMKRLDRFLPSETKTKQQNIQGIRELSKYLANKTSLQLGYDVTPLVPEEMGEDPLKVFGGTTSKKNPLDL